MEFILAIELLLECLEQRGYPKKIRIQYNNRQVYYTCTKFDKITGRDKVSL
jgi:hypothetical protein